MTLLLPLWDAPNSWETSGEPEVSYMGAQRVERRLAAILAADIVGYSRLVERDEAGTLGTIKGLRET